VPVLRDIDVRPDPSEVDKISPSALNRLLECPKKLAYGRDGRTKGWQRPTTRTALGIVAHGLTEAAERTDGSLADRDRAEWLRAIWDDLVAKQVAQLQKAWPGRQIPPAHSWPGYAVTKVRLTRSLARRARGQAPTAQKPVGQPVSVTGTQPPLPWVERRLEDAGRRLFGTPDRVEEVNGRLRVVDLKSGVGQDDVSDSQLRQLLVYAWLVKSSLGRLPDDVVVLDTKGQEKVHVVEASAVDAVVTMTAAAVDRFNDSLQSAAGAEALPAPETCRWCEFRVICGDYWAARASNWPTSKDIAGVVVGITTPYVELQLLDSQEHQRLVLTGLEQPSMGDVVVAVDVELAGFETSRTRWNSRLRVLPLGANEPAHRGAMSST